jgi:hypothetical protein
LYRAPREEEEAAKAQVVPPVTAVQMAEAVVTEGTAEA